MKMFRKSASAATAVEAENPYLSARRRWDDYVGGVASSRRSWQLIALLAMLTSAVAVAGAVAIGAQSKFVPYVIEVDKLGSAVAVAPALQAAPADPRVVKAQVADFIASVRLVTPDVQLQRKAIFRAFAMLSQGDPAYAKINNYFRAPGTSPAERMGVELASAEIVSVLPQTGDTWQVEWNELVYERSGEPKGPPTRWRALVTVRVAAPDATTPEEVLRMNPLGIYVRDYSWSKTV